MTMMTTYARRQSCAQNSMLRTHTMSPAPPMPVTARKMAGRRSTLASTPSRSLRTPYISVLLQHQGTSHLRLCSSSELNALAIVGIACSEVDKGEASSWDAMQEWGMYAPLQSVYTDGSYQRQVLGMHRLTEPGEMVEVRGRHKKNRRTTRLYYDAIE